MPTSPAKIYGAALIADTYSVSILALDPEKGKCHLNTRAIHLADRPPSPRQHRPLFTAWSDWCHENFTWQTKDPTRGMNIRPRLRHPEEYRERCEEKAAAREIRNLAKQKGERVPGKREALAMVHLQDLAKETVSVAYFHEGFLRFGIQGEKNFFVVSWRTGKRKEEEKEEGNEVVEQGKFGAQDSDKSELESHLEFDSDSDSESDLPPEYEERPSEPALFAEEQDSEQDAGQKYKATGAQKHDDLLSDLHLDTDEDADSDLEPEYEEGPVEAALYVEEKEGPRLLARMAGKDHFGAVDELFLELRINRRQRLRNRKFLRSMGYA